MVKRLLRHLLILALLMAVLLAAAGWWLLGSSAGARWLLAELSRRTAISIAAETVEGRLYDELRLRGVQVVWSGGEGRIADCMLRWRPLGLLAGHLRVDALEMSGGFLAWEAAHHETDDSDASFAWPRLGGWPVRLRGSLAALRLADLELRPPGSEPQRIERLSAGLSWQGGALTLSGLEAAAAGFSLQGSAAAGFAQPQLRLDLRLSLPDARAGYDTATLKTELAETAGADLAGPLELAGRSGEQTHLALTAEIELQGETLRLERFELTAPDRPGVLGGSGQLSLGAEAPGWSLKVKLAGVDLAPETGVTTDLAGFLEARGNGSGYRGSFDLENRKADWQSARLAGTFAGNWERIEMSRLKGAWLQGTLSGALRLDWREGFSLSADLQGRRLDPATITPQWPGRVSFDLAGEVSWPAAGEPVGSVRGRLLESTLRGRVFSGRVAAGWRGEDLRIDALELRGDGFDLSSSGRLAERLEFRADVERLSALLPGGEGAFSAQGWLRWRDGVPAGAVDLRARELLYEDLSVGRLQLSAGLPGGEGPLVLAARGSRIALGRWQLQSVVVDMGGQLESHTLGVQAVWSQGELQLAARGGWRQGRWSGSLERLSGDDADAGPWRLVEPVALEAGADRLRLDSLHLQGAGDAQLRLTADMIRQPWRGEVEALWEGIDLSRANPWLGEVDLEGLSSGSSRFRLFGDGGFEIETDLTAAGGVRHGGRTLVVPELTGELRWGREGLISRLALRFGKEGSFEGRLSSPEALRQWPPRQWAAEAYWERFELGFFDAWLEPVELSGQSSGELRAQLHSDGSLELTGSLEAAGSLREGELQAEVSRARSDLRWNVGGLQGEVLLELANGGRLGGRLSSRQPGRLEWPERGRLEADWSGIELARLQPLLPSGIALEGEFSGRGGGEWLPGGELALAGEAGVDGGRFSWQGEHGTIAAELRRARLDWQWRGESLSGALELALAEKGEAVGKFRLPLPARLPTSIVSQGALELVLDARMRELGLLSFFFPAHVRESRGEVEVQARVSGSWERPQLAGNFRLSKAGAYLPVAGIELREVALEGVLAGEELRIESFSVLSGPGQIEGNGSLRLRQWRPVAYRGELRGERFETVYLPELHLLSSPELSFEGTPERLKVRGRVEIPELFFQGREQRDVERENPDVVIVGAGAPERSFPLDLDIEVRLLLGDKAQVRVAGVNAQLGGEVDLRVAGPDAVTARGEIRTIKGIYSVYGVELKIVRGRLLYSGGPIDQPTLDILALRTAGEVKAGVQVGGKPRNPAVKLYSEPAMPDTDILSYIVLGHPMGQETGQAGLLAAAAGALLARGESATVQSQIRQRLGLDVLEVGSGGDEVGASMVTIGKYLSPDLYLSFGQSLFADTSEARLRYTISRRWEIESKMGEQSGVDLYYKIEFD